MGSSVFACVRALVGRPLATRSPAACLPAPTSRALRAHLPGPHLSRTHTRAQVYPSGLRHIRPDRRINEWRAPGRKIIQRSATNERQVAIAFAGGELIYFELNPQARQVPCALGLGFGLRRVGWAANVVGRRRRRVRACAPVRRRGGSGAATPPFAPPTHPPAHAPQPTLTHPPTSACRACWWRRRSASWAATWLPWTLPPCPRGASALASWRWGRTTAPCGCWAWILTSACSR